jgi:hypothetical protein
MESSSKALKKNFFRPISFACKLLLLVALFFVLLMTVWMFFSWRLSTLK